MSPFAPTRLRNPPPPQLQCRTGAKPRWAPAGSGKSVCTSSEKKKIEDAFQTAFAWVDNAKNYLDRLADLSPAKRERMWNWGSFLPGSIHESVAHRWDHYWSPGTWFGWYTNDRFYTVWDRVTRLWYRMQNGTKKNYAMRFVCRAHRNCFGVAAAYHSPTSVGRVTLCKDWFSGNTPMERAEKILHESMHYLVNDSIVTNRPKDVRSKTACGSKGKLSNVCYRATNSYSLRSLWESAAVDNIDNYNYWMRTMFYTVGCWPPRTFSHMGYNLGNWVRPAPVAKKTLIPPITKKGFVPLPGHKELKPPIPTKTLDP